MPCSNSSCLCMLMRGQILEKLMFLASLTHLHSSFGKRLKLLHTFFGRERVNQLDLKRLITRGKMADLHSVLEMTSAAVCFVLFLCPISFGWWMVFLSAVLYALFFMYIELLSLKSVLCLHSCCCAVCVFCIAAVSCCFWYDHAVLIFTVKLLLAMHSYHAANGIWTVVTGSCKSWVLVYRAFNVRAACGGPSFWEAPFLCALLFIKRLCISLFVLTFHVLPLNQVPLSL